jgi:hypothetical protein
MTAIRSWIRRGLADKYRCYPLPSHLDDISIVLGFRCMAHTKQVPKAFEPGLDSYAYWVIPNANNLSNWRGPPWDTRGENGAKMNGDDSPMQHDPRIGIRMMLQRFATDQNQDPLMRMAVCLHVAFSSTLELWKLALRVEDFRSPTMVSDFEGLSWTLPVHSYDQGLGLQHKGLLLLTCPTPTAHVWEPPKDISELHAMLSIWSTTLDGGYALNGPPYLRVLGHWSRYSLASLESLPRWIGGSLAVEPVPIHEEHSFFGSHRVDYACVVHGLLFGLSLNAHRK